jgi:hypothetical protein
VLKQSDAESGYAELSHFYAVVPQHPFHAVQIRVMIREMLSEVSHTRGKKIDKILTDSFDSPGDVEPVQPVPAALSKPAHYTAQPVFTVRQDGQFGYSCIAAGTSQNGLHLLFRVVPASLRHDISDQA